MPQNQARAKSKPVEWYQIKAKSNSEAEILIFEEIGESFFGGGIGAKRFAKDLKAIGDVSRITLRINSPGGSVFDGTAIYNTLRAHKAKKTVYIDGIAASIASVIAMAGDEVIMPANTMMMIHDPWIIAAGSSEDMRKTAEMLDKTKESILASYRRTGLDDGTLAAMMTEETWMTADEAVEFGFADTMTEELVSAAAMSFNFSKYNFKHTPEILIAPAVQPENNINKSMKKKGELKNMITLEQLKNEAPELLASIQDNAKSMAMAETEEKIAAARNEAAEAERKRIQDVENQLMPGHQELINQLKFDGKTTGPEAAVQVLNAERAKQQQVAKDLKSDAPEPVSQAQNPENTNKEPSLLEQPKPISMEKAQELWNSDPELKKAFSNAKYLYNYCKYSN